MHDYWIGVLFLGGVLFLVWLNRHQTEETHELDEDYDIPTMRERKEESDGDYWCPICGYHATKKGYFDAHLMNDHNNNK